MTVAAINDLTVKPIRLFISYSHKDEQFREELSSHLKLLERMGVLSAWHDRRIPAGTKWKEQIDSYIDEAEIVICLVSANFFQSDYCYENEMKRALSRHERGEAIVIPIIVQSVDWGRSPLASLQALPPEAKPIEEWDHQAQAWTAVVQGLMEAAKGIFGVRETTQRAVREGAATIDPSATINPSVKAILSLAGSDDDHDSSAEALPSYDLVVLRLRAPKAAELIFGYRQATASYERFCKKQGYDTLLANVKDPKITDNGKLTIAMALFAEKERRGLRALIAEAEALLALEDAAVPAGLATKELLQPRRYGLDRSLAAVSDEIARAMDTYTAYTLAVEQSFQILIDVAAKIAREIRNFP